MKDKKNKKKFVIVSQQLHPSQINELSMCCFIVNIKYMDKLLSFIVNNGGRVVAAVQCCGIPRNSIEKSINGYLIDECFIMATCQKEITDIFMLNICKEFDFNKTGHGKGFVIDILGYMGAKGPFVE